MDIELSADTYIDTIARVRDALGEAQRIGMLGDESIEAVIERSLGLVHLLPVGTRTVIDLGSGGGDPGVVIAAACPSVQVTLVDRRAKRTDFLTRIVGRLDMSERVEVVEADVAHLPSLFPDRMWDVATSRGFGPPAYTARHAALVVRPGGQLLVTEPPGSSGERWSEAEVREAGWRLDEVSLGVAVLTKELNKEL